MKNSRQDVIDALLLFASKYDKSEGFTYLLTQAKSPLPEISQLIICEMFKNRFDFHNCSEEEYEAYYLILEYYTELHDIGYVRHE